MENKKKNSLPGKGCLIALIIGIILFFLLLIICVIFSDEATDKPIDNKIENIIDSTQIKYNDSLRLETKKKIDAERQRLDIKYDDIEQVTWIYSKSKPKYTNTMAFFNYIGLKDDGQRWKRIVIRYHGNDWLFINKIIIKTDNQTYTLNASDSKRDHNADVWEWIDIAEGDTEYVMINDIINSSAVKVRFVGQQYHRDWILTKKEIKGLKEIEDYYYLLDSYYTR
jgi:hypothetical protein